MMSLKGVIAHLRPTLSIVIPSHHRTDLLGPCLASVIQHAPPGTEVLVVDDASPMGAVAQAARAFPGVKVIRLPRRSGFCAAANRGIREASGDIVELLNDDTEVMPGWASAALACFQVGTVAAVAPLVLCASPDGRPTRRIDSAGDQYYWGGVAAKRGHGETIGATFLRGCRVFGASASSSFYRRETILRLGAMPESFGAYFEDVDLAFRLNRAGYEVRYEPASRVLHRVSASHGTRSRRLLEQQSLNEERVFWRNVPRAWMRRALPRHLAVLLGKALRRWEEGNLAPFLFGRLRILRELAALRQYRGQLARESSRPTAWCVDERWA